MGTGIVGAAVKFRLTAPISAQPVVFKYTLSVTVKKAATAIRSGAAHYSGLALTNVSVNGTALTAPASAP